MIVRVYVDGRLIVATVAETQYLDKAIDVGRDVSLVLVPEHPGPYARAMVLEGKLQRA